MFSHVCMTRTTTTKFHVPCNAAFDCHGNEETTACFVQANVFLTSSGTAVLAVSGLAPDGHDGDNHHPQSLYRCAAQLLHAFLWASLLQCV